MTQCILCPEADDTLYTLSSGRGHSVLFVLRQMTQCFLGQLTQIVLFLRQMTKCFLCPHEADRVFDEDNPLCPLSLGRRHSWHCTVCPLSSLYDTVCPLSSGRRHSWHCTVCPLSSYIWQSVFLVLRQLTQCVLCPQAADTVCPVSSGSWHSVSCVLLTDMSDETVAKEQGQGLHKR